MMSDPSSKLTNFIPKKTTKITREAPMNVGAEQALLGAIISNNLALEKVENFLEPEHFSSKINGLIFQTLQKLISILTAERLKRERQTGLNNFVRKVIF